MLTILLVNSSNLYLLSSEWLTLAWSSFLNASISMAMRRGWPVHKLQWYHTGLPIIGSKVQTTSTLKFLLGHRGSYWTGVSIILYLLGVLASFLFYLCKRDKKLLVHHWQWQWEPVHAVVACWAANRWVLRLIPAAGQDVLGLMWIIILLIALWFPVFIRH